VISRRAAVLLVSTANIWALSAFPAAAATTPPQIHTVAGGGACVGKLTAGGPCDNVPATSIPIGQARSVAALPDGSFLYADYVNNMVREVSPTGVVTTVAGNGTNVDSPVPAVATKTGLDGPVAVAPLPGGGFLVTEYDGSVVRRVSAGLPGDATITTIAGTGTPGSNGKSGDGTSIELNYPTDAEPTADGRVLIADTYNNEIKVLSLPVVGATISSIAGDGSCDDATSACDGSAAGGVRLHHPDSVSPIQGGAGGYLIAEYDSATIRRVSNVASSATFTTVAGVAGHSGFGGDGGPATSALLDHPEQVVSTGDGAFLIADTNNERIRQVSPAGTIATVAGNGKASSGGDGGDATAAALQGPAGTAPLGDGGFLIADANNGAIREVTIPPSTTIATTPAAPNGNDGWYVSTIHTSLSAPGGAQTSCLLDPTSPPTVFDELLATCPFTGGGADITGDGSHTLYAASINAFGDKELPVSLSVKLDTTPPTVQCSSGSAPSFALDAPGVLSAAVADQISGPVSPTVSAPANTTASGAQTATLTGADNAGLTATVTCPYTVLPARFKPAPLLHWAFSAHHAYATITRLFATRVPARAAVNLMCSGKGCPFSRKVESSTGTRKLDLTTLFKGSRLAIRTQLTVSVTKPSTIGRVWTFTIGARGRASDRVSCLAPGSTVPGKDC
jgi:hypothetical protein